MANQEQGVFRPEQEQGAFRPELDEPRRTTEHQVETETEKNGYFPTSGEEGGYGGVSEQEPPHHKIHTDDEPLPKPKPGMYDDVQDEVEPREEQVMPTGTSDDVTAPKSTEQYQDFRSENEPKAPFDGKLTDLVLLHDTLNCQYIFITMSTSWEIKSLFENLVIYWF